MQSGEIGGDRWERIEELFSAALDLPATERSGFLESACRGDDSLRAELESLLQAADEAEDYFDTLSRKAGIPGSESSPPLGLEGRCIGAYRLVRLLGRGGMGAVFLAEREDGHFEQRVALKLLPVGMATAEGQRRFLAERRLLARLEHPNIARLLDGGITDDGIPYFVMELVEGLRIDEHCRRYQLGIEERLELFLQVLEAVQYAHRRSIVHRDLKPANILVSDEGRVKLLDFGVAKLLDAADAGSPTTLTRLGGRPMTPRYASPEQLDGGSVSPATDVYALGVLLYELLTGATPFQLEGLSTEQVRRIICGEDPEPPSRRMRGEGGNGSAPRLRRRMAGDLDKIVLTALQKKPEQRYPTAAAFRDDIQRHLEARPVRARGASRIHRVGRFLTRHQFAASVPAISALTVLALSVWPAAPSVPILAVGSIENRTGSATPGADALPDLLATNLAAFPGLQVISNERMHEIRAQLGADISSGTRSVARQAGADEVVEGALYPRAGGGLRLELRRVDVRTGRIRGTQLVEGDEVPDLVRAALSRMAGELETPPPLQNATSGDTYRSLVARRLYDEGLRAFYQSDASAADRLFTAALAEDSTLAMAAYYLWRTRSNMGISQRGDTTLTRSGRLAERAPERDRLLIRAAWARSLQDPAYFALAESLAVRHPLEPDGPLLLGSAAVSRGDFLGAIPHFRRVIEMDSLSLRGVSAHCRACDAFRGAFDAYGLADSIAAAERIAREWIGLQPTSPQAWTKLSDALLFQDRYDEALATRHRAASFRAGDAVGPIFRAHLALRVGDWNTADRLLEEAIEASSPDLQREALWWRAISLREQGRLREALTAARQYRRMVEEERADLDQDPPYTALIEAQMLLELGHARRAAALFDSIAVASVAPESRGWTARARAWALTHKATALAAAGDTAALLPLARRVRAVGAESGFGRDWRLHHYIHGLLLVRRGQAAGAEQQFRQAIYSLPTGFSRVNLELGRTLLSAGRPNDAVAVLSPALRGPLEAGNLYVSRTGLHAELGRAWEMAGHPDSAGAHYRWVLDAWRDADPMLHPRREAVRVRLATLGGQ